MSRGRRGPRYGKGRGKNLLQNLQAVPPAETEHALALRETTHRDRARGAVSNGAVSQKEAWAGVKGHVEAQQQSQRSTKGGLARRRGVWG